MPEIVPQPSLSRRKYFQSGSEHSASRYSISKSLGRPAPTIPDWLLFSLNKERRDGHSIGGWGEWVRGLPSPCPWLCQYRREFHRSLKSPKPSCLPACFS